MTPRQGLRWDIGGDGWPRPLALSLSGFYIGSDGWPRPLALSLSRFDLVALVLTNSPSLSLGEVGWGEGAGWGGVVGDGKWIIDSDPSHATAYSALPSPLLPPPFPSPPLLASSRC